MSRVVEVAEGCVDLSTRDGCLLISGGGSMLASVPLGEVDCLVLGSPRATISVAALAALAELGCAAVICGSSAKPAGLVLPFRPQHEVGARILAQAAASKPLRNRVWKWLVQSKIRGQAQVLAEQTGGMHGLDLMARRVKAGDPENVEARAARRYWQMLLGKKFRRRRGQGLGNMMLDYGYTILRSAVARSICSAGLHPSLGVHHRHRANAFALTDDVIEPFRPVVDRVVCRCLHSNPTGGDLTPGIKRQLAACLDERVPIDGQSRRATDALSRCSASLAGLMLGERQDLVLPWMS